MALPQEFIARTRALLKVEYDLFESSLQNEVPVSVRLNNRKKVERKLSNPVTWCDSAYYLPERLTFTFDPLFHAGEYYVQEASSMFLEQVIRNYVTEPVVCLDLCAAPGGKSTHLLSLLPEDSLLVCNEVIRSRSHILAENVTKWGMPNAVVTNNDPEKIGELTHFFDLIVTDVPCSGEGMFRKDVDSTEEWSVANVDLCASRQRRIIHDIWNALKPGGILVYSTCTYNTEENEDNIHYIIEELGAEPLDVPTKPEWNITGALKHDAPVYRFLPHKTKGEGFFLAVLRKSDADLHPVKLKTKNKKNKSTKPTPVPSAVKGWITDANQFSIEVHNDVIRAFPTRYRDEISYLYESLHVMMAGIQLGEIKGNDVIPSHGLALSTKLNPDSFTTTELSWEEAVKYLRKESILLPDTQKGYILLTYQNHPIGFVKNLGNRSNNLYPQEWRIRTGYVPETLKLL